MDNIVSIINTKPTELDFEVGVDGLSPKKMEVRFFLKASDHCLMFKCKKSKGDTWSCKIPALSYLEKGAYSFFIEVVADGYHFEAMKGVANITGSFDVYAKKAEKIKPEKKKVKKNTTKEADEKSSMRKAESVAEKILSENKGKSLNLNNMVRQIVNETKNTETKFIQDIIKKKLPEHNHKTISTNKERNVVTEVKRESSKIDENVKHILESYQNEMKQQSSPFKFKKGKTVG